MQSISHHNLIEEFPEYKDKIHELKMSNKHFQRLADELHELDKEIRRHEEDIEPVSDAFLEDQKKKRLKLTDELYAMMRAD